MCPKKRRIEAWERLSKDLPMDKLSGVMKIVPLSEIVGYADKILQGQVQGRIVVDVKN